MMAEVAWPKEPMPCVLIWPEGEAEGYLHFVGPDDRYAVVPVTRGATYHDAALRRNVWHIDDDGGELVTTSPSLHFIGQWHSPYTTGWRVLSREPFDRQSELRALLDDS